MGTPCRTRAVIRGKYGRDSLPYSRGCSSLVGRFGSRETGARDFSQFILISTFFEIFSKINSLWGPNSHFNPGPPFVNHPTHDTTRILIHPQFALFIPISNDIPLLPFLGPNP